MIFLADFLVVIYLSTDGFWIFAVGDLNLSLKMIFYITELKERTVPCTSRGVLFTW